ncbi:RING-H2 finger protein ATL2 [Amborella trichopoda]|uniref:RING-type E3 ubiquitin transferase n=1 Tax=Amborella trichopoda TaxID=13333 RepID=W1NKM3_AMBTC|nr:RING-H2 finger protein ATL2 [Amborella trichopoda]ERM96021.1 hypothetical protein AMTR_s00129p00065710 [Amborella trichopoda]|eukprot:XP_006828605.1 RING-H2 finger protein ATL2 [Amborella trichopoda]
MGDSFVNTNFETPQQPQFVDGKVLVAGIIVLLIAVVFVLFLHLYTRLYWSRNGTDALIIRRRFVFASDLDPVLVQRQGLDASIIESLPVYDFDLKREKDGLDCAVCLCEFQENEKVRLLPKCNHKFHIECIDMWFHSHSTCPLCRSCVKMETPLIESSENSNSAGSETSIQIVVPIEENQDSATREDGPNYPTNVLFWGNQDQLNSGLDSSSSEERSRSLKKVSENLVIEIPRRGDAWRSLRVADGESSEGGSSSGLSLKSPVARFRSLTRMLSREKRSVPCSPIGGETRSVPCSPLGGDLEQGVGGSNHN